MVCTIGYHANNYDIEFLKDFQKNGIKQLRNKSYGKGKEKMKKNISKKAGNNRGPPEQSYYWGARGLMGYPLEKLFGCNVLIRFL